MRLVYFNAMGLAETSRLLLALAQVKYEDYRFPLEVIDSDAHKYKKDDFDTAKADGKFNCSMGKLPFLEIDGEIIFQSKAIERFLARRYGFMGSNELEAAKIDAICESIRDFKDKYLQNKDNEKYFEEILFKDLNDLVKVLGNSSCFAVGDKVSLADITIYNFVTNFFKENLNKKYVIPLAGQIDKIREIVINIASRPEIIVWKQKRPKTLF